MVLVPSDSVAPSNAVVPFWPWHPWQIERFLLASLLWSVTGTVADGAKGIWWKWHRVLLKHPAVPGAAFAFPSVELAPPVWQAAQIPTLPASVVSWVGCPATRENQGFPAWGALTPLPWQAALFIQLGAVPLLNVAPWQDWQDEKPVLPLGAFLASAP
jgi:hypothetical protein